MFVEKKEKEFVMRKMYFIKIVLSTDSLKF